MDQFPILDYTPATLLGVGILLLLFGKLLTPAALKPYIEQNLYLRSALEKSQATEAEAIKALIEEQKTSEIIRRVLGDLEHRAGS